MSFAWTEERLENMRDMFRQNFTATQIADKLGGGLSRNAVCGKLHRLGLARGIAVRAPRPSKPVKQDKPAAPNRKGIGAQVQAINRPKMEAEPFVCVEAADVVPLHLSLLELNDCMCRWPYGDGPVYTFCANPTLDGPYCYPHHLLSLPAPADRKAKQKAAA